MSTTDDLTELMPSLPGSNSDSAALRERVLRQTTGVLPRRRRIKRLSFAVALVGCYVAGAATITLLRPTNSPDPAIIAVSVEKAPLAPGSAGGSSGYVATKSEVGSRKSDGTIENGSPPVHRPVRPEDDGVFPELASKSPQVAAAKLTPYDRLRLAGDKQLEEQNDIAAAAHTYRRALQVASSDQRSISVDNDSWLLMAMKNDQSQTIAENTP